MRQLSYTSPGQLQARLKGLSVENLIAHAAALRPRPGGDRVVFATKVSLASLGRRAQALEEEIASLDELIATRVQQTAPRLLELFGVGIDTAAALLVAAGEPRAPALGGGLRPPLRRGAGGSLLGQDHTPSPGPWR